MGNCAKKPPARVITLPNQITQYKVIRRLGQGSYGKVYLVKIPSQHQFAMKIIPYRDNTKQIVMEEINLMRKVNNVNVLKAYQVFMDEKQMEIKVILQYCNGGDLEDHIESKSDKVYEIMSQITSGLLNLHHNKIIHRDLKPSNILIRYGVIKIADLGTAKFLKAGGCTATINQFGTDWYRAPETNYSQKYTQKIDVWALGLIFLELIAGKRLNQLLDGLEAPHKRIGFPSYQLLENIRDLKMRELVRKMLQPKVQDRVSTQDVWEQLSHHFPHDIDNLEIIQINSQIIKKDPEIQRKIQELKSLALKNQWKPISDWFDSNKDISDMRELILNGPNNNLQFDIKSSVYHVRIITQIKGFQPLLNLRILNLRYNCIEVIQNLETLNELEQLWLSSNKIKKIKNIQHLQKLKILALDFNSITKIQNLNNLRLLIKLYLGHNQISKIENLENLTLLQQLELKQNKISTLENLDNLKCLKKIDLINNPIGNTNQNKQTVKSIKKVVKRVSIKQDIFNQNLINK